MYLFRSEHNQRIEKKKNILLWHSLYKFLFQLFIVVTNLEQGEIFNRCPKLNVSITVLGTRNKSFDPQRTEWKPG